MNKDRLEKDDYFRRQDMDNNFQSELKVNLEITQLLETNGRKIKIAMATSSPADVGKRVFDIGMEVFWWNPMYDDPDKQGSLTRKLQETNNFPCINAGGNVGSACWMIGTAVLDIQHIALTGVDFSYYIDTPFRNTQYYHEAVSLIGEENLDSFFIKIHNPHLDQTFFTDPAYMWYRESFLEMLKDDDHITYNCTEGGILFGENISFIPLREFLDRMSKKG